jgi:plastocyanin
MSDRDRMTPRSAITSIRAREPRSALPHRARLVLLATVSVWTGAACSSDDTSTTGTTTPVDAAASTSLPQLPAADHESRPHVPNVPQRVALRLAAYAISPSEVFVPEGDLEIAVENHDGAPHNVAVVATDLPPSQLPTAGIRVDESSDAIAVVARTVILGAHETATVTARLTPGRYVLVCTVPHHYVRNHMAGVLTVSSSPRSTTS